MISFALMAIYILMAIYKNPPENFPFDGPIIQPCDVSLLSTWTINSRVASDLIYQLEQQTVWCPLWNDSNHSNLVVWYSLWSHSNQARKSYNDVTKHARTVWWMIYTFTKLLATADVAYGKMAGSELTPTLINFQIYIWCISSTWLVGI